MKKRKINIMALGILTCFLILTGCGKSNDYLCFPEPEELIGDEKYEGGYYFGRIKFDGRE